MTSQFVEQVQILMHAQQLKSSECIFGKSNNYTWLTNRRRPSFIWMSTKDEFAIRRALNKLKEEEKVEVMKQLVKWLEQYPDVSSLKVPELCIQLLSKMETSAVIHSTTMSRMRMGGSFRSSLRRLSSVVNKNRVSPSNLGLPLPINQNIQRRSVTFNDEPTIYSIYN